MASTEWGQLLFPNTPASPVTALPRRQGSRTRARLPKRTTITAGRVVRTAPDRLFGAPSAPARYRRGGHRVRTVWPRRASDRVLRESHGVGSAVDPHPLLGSPLRRSEQCAVPSALTSAVVAACVHVGRRAGDRAGHLIGLNAMMAGADWLLSSNFARFPNLNVILRGWCRLGAVHHRTRGQSVARPPHRLRSRPRPATPKPERPPSVLVREPSTSASWTNLRTPALDQTRRQHSVRR